MESKESQLKKKDCYCCNNVVKDREDIFLPVTRFAEANLQALIMMSSSMR